MNEEEEQEISKAVDRQIKIWAELIGSMKNTTDEIVLQVYQELNKDLRMNRMSKNRKSSKPVSSQQLGYIVQLNGDINKAKKMNTREASSYIDELKKAKSGKGDE